MDELLKITTDGKTVFIQLNGYTAEVPIGDKNYELLINGYCHDIRSVLRAVPAAYAEEANHEAGSEETP